MIMITDLQYVSLVQTISEIPCPFDKWEQLKERYKDAIASTRSLDRCKTLLDFIKLLQKRDLINEQNITILEDIASVLGRDSIMIGLIQETNLHIIQVLPDFPTDIDEKINYIIGRDIGYRWKDFARGLGIREGEIDDLEIEYRGISERIRRILDYCRHNFAQNVYRTNVLRALREARRKDLSNYIADIIDNSV